MKNFHSPVLFLLALTLFGSCKQNNKNTNMAESNEKQDSVYVVDLKAVDYAFAMPSEFPSGWITFRMENMGEQNHVAMIYESTSDLSIEEIRSKMDSADYDFPRTLVGGPGFHSPNQKSDITIHLEPGNYVMTCFLKTESGKSHFDLGMKRAFRVTENLSGATKPNADTQITLKKYDNSRSKSFAEGQQTVEIIHEDFPLDFHLLEVKDSTTIEKALRYMDVIQDPSPVEWLTGVKQADAGRSTFITYSFSPGEYAWISHEFGLWGVMDRFTIEEGATENRIIKNQEEKNVNKVEIQVVKNDILVNGDIKAGINTFHFLNNAKDEHDIYIVRIKEGENKESFLKWLNLPREKKTYGSWPWRAYPIKLKGEENTATVEVNPGTYLISCNAKSENGKRHHDQGEITEFVVK
ncbi:hypothetical protein LB450_11970 [Psychroflexus sp. CAK1W]|uniref:hypothetical protein n=1 Tax=Psychroflexus curvus TaxID=2873595 RepID=UPI001CC9294F|nr:hypothetical protein [Psychroflexus curvus]MBZ9628821.1 hypothetical protein [Psychroflexus curvus]